MERKILFAACTFIMLLWAPISPESGAGELASSHEPEVIFMLSNGETVRLTVEVAATPASLQHGLMFRRHLDARRGMLFIFPHASRHTMWMKNTFIPLDIIFINENMRIVGVVENAQPLSTTSLGVAAPSRYVVEANAFFCRKNGIRPGDRVTIKGVRTEP